MMQKLRRKSQKWRGLTTVFCTILMICLCVSSVISSFSGFFGGTPAEITDLSGESEESLQYFKSSYDSIGEMLEAKSDLCEQISDEGIVLVKNDGVLPLDGVKKVTCLGRSSTDLIYGGSSGAGTIGNAGTSINATLKQSGIWDVLYGFLTGIKSVHCG